jgi:hypothetical protein
MKREEKGKRSTHERPKKKEREKKKNMSQSKKVSWLEMDGREEGKEGKTL